MDKISLEHLYLCHKSYTTLKNCRWTLFID